MKLRTSLDGVSYRFTGITDVLAKASEPKSGDRLTGIAAASASERLAAKVVLAELTVGDLTLEEADSRPDRSLVRGLDLPGHLRHGERPQRGHRLHRAEGQVVPGDRGLSRL